MPYFKEDGQRIYKYQLAIGQFTPEELDPDSREVLNVLRELGAEAVRCTYNGGYDEGFAEFEAAVFVDKTVKLDELKRQLTDSSLGSKTSDYLRNYYYNQEPSSAERVQFYLELFASELAICLLGQGYGTGEYSMKGSFRAILATGEIIDEQQQ